MQDAAQGDQHQQGRHHLQRLRGRVRGARGERHRPDHERGDQRREQGVVALAPGADEADAERQRPEQRREVEDRGRDRAVAGLDPEVAARPDAEHLERRDVAEEVAEVVVEEVERPLLRLAARRPSPRACGQERPLRQGCAGLGVARVGDVAGAAAEVDDPRGLRGDEQDEATTATPSPASAGRTCAIAAAGERTSAEQRPRSRSCRRSRRGRGPSTSRASRRRGPPPGIAQPRLPPARGSVPRLEIPEPDREGEQEGRREDLLEGTLGQIGGDEVRQRDERRRERAAPRAERAGRCQRRHRPDHRHGDRHAREPVDEVAGRELAAGDRERVRADRVALLDQRRRARDRLGDPRGGEQVLGHVDVEAGAEDPEVALDEERDRDGDERDRGRDRALGELRHGRSRCAAAPPRRRAPGPRSRSGRRALRREAGRAARRRP